MLLKCAIFAAIRPQLMVIFIRHLSILNGLEDRNYDFSREIGNHFYTSCRNLVRFGSVTPELKT